MESKRPLSCLWCGNGGSQSSICVPVLFSLRLQPRKLCVRLASSHHLFIITGLGLRCEPLAQHGEKF